MASGLILTLLCVTGESSLWALALGTSLPVIALLSILRTRPGGKVLAAGITAAGVIVWLIAGGAADAVEVVRALLLHFSGLTAALPLVARPFAAILGVTCGFIGYGLTSRRVGAYPALATVLLMALLLWLGNRPDALWGLLPAIIPCVALLMVSGYDEISVTRVLPLTLVVVLLSFTGVAIGGITVQPMKEAADALRQKIYDYLFFTSARDVFSIASQGYYPQGPTQLGGAATPSERPVLRVSGSGRIYLRAVTKSSYTGSMWIDETGGRRYLWSSPRWQNLRSQTFDLTLPDETLAANLPTKTVTVTMLSDSASSLFVPQRIRELSVGSGIVPYFNAGSEIFATRNLTSGDTWTATYVDLTAGQSGLAELIDAGAQLTDAQYEDIRKLYTGLPGHLEQRLFDFARNAAGSADYLRNGAQHPVVFAGVLPLFAGYSRTGVEPRFRFDFPADDARRLLHALRVRHDGAVPHGRAARAVCGRLRGGCGRIRADGRDRHKRPRVDGNLLSGRGLGDVRRNAVDIHAERLVRAQPAG